ncbi:unnamed protein product [Gadus morhua 'NCC']
MEQMKMNPSTLSVLLLLAGPLGADPDWHVEYPDSFCVVEGSTATIPCSFTHPAGLRVERVVWCPNQVFCNDITLYVYDSSNLRADNRFQYLGDLVGNCTLKIIKTVKRDTAMYRVLFRTNVGGWGGQKGVRVTVTGGEDVKVRSSVTDHVVKEGGQVTLTCTSACSFHRLDVHWYRNGNALSETGPALHLSNLTNDDAGDYTCSLDSIGQNTSAPWCLLVVNDEDGEDVKVRSSVTDHVVKEGGQVTLTCTSACSFHQLDVLWYRNGQALSETGPALHLSSLTNDDTGDYTCSLDSSGQNTSVPWCLLVGEYEDGEVVKVRSSVTDHVVKEGGQVTLTCTSACSFHQLDVLWYRNGHALSETGPALHLSGLTNNNTGNYTCSLDSSGQNTSAPWSLLVGEYEDGEVVKVRSSVTDHVVKEGGQVTLTCTSACSFHQLDVHWYRNGHALSETGPALHLSNLTNDDAGNYTCSLDSSGQNTSAPWCLLVGEYEDGEVVKVRSSVTDHVVKEGGQVTLTCTSACSFHQLDVHWYRNGHALSETGPALHLSSLTNNNTGNYTCSLNSSGQKTTTYWSLVVVKDEEGRFDWHLTVSVVLKVLWAVFLLLLAGLVFAKRSAPGPEHEIVYSEVVG